MFSLVSVELCALVEAGADKDKTDPQGFTALMFACSSANFKCACALIEKGAEFEKPNNNGGTPFMYARVNKDELCAQLIVQAYIDKRKVAPTGARALNKKGATVEKGADLENKQEAFERERALKDLKAALALGVIDWIAHCYRLAESLGCGRCCCVKKAKQLLDEDALRRRRVDAAEAKRQAAALEAAEEERAAKAEEERAAKAEKEQAAQQKPAAEAASASTSTVARLQVVERLPSATVCPKSSRRIRS